MSKTLTYSGSAIAGLLVILAFVTAKSYTQLGVAILLYTLFVYFVLKVFPRRTWKVPAVAIHTLTQSTQKIAEAKREKVDVADIDKRTFLKLVGAAGLSFFVFSFLGKKVETLLFSRAFQSGINGIGSIPNSETNLGQPLNTDGYKISEIDDGIISYYGFINSNGGWFITREDTEKTSFRYAKADSDFSDNWAKRENLKYDYYYNIF